MNSTLVSRLTHGLGGQVFGTAVQMGIRFAEPPLFVIFWGGRLYGEWIIIAAIPSFLVMVEASFSDVARREMMMRHGSGDTAGALAVFQSIWLPLLLFSLCFGGIVLATAYMLPLKGWLGIETIDRNSLYAILFLLGIHMMLSTQAGLLYGAFQCRGRYGLGAGLAALMQLLEFCGMAAAVVLKLGPVAAAVGCLAGRSTGLLIMRLCLYRVVPWLRYGLGLASFTEFNRLWRPAIAGLAFPVGMALNIQGMRLVIGMVLGPSAVTVFVVTRTLCQLASQPVAFTYRLMEAEMAWAFGSGQGELLMHLYRRLCSVSVWGALILSLALAISGEWLLAFWTHGHTQMNEPLYALMLMAIVANSVWSAVLALPFVTNRYQDISVGYIFINGLAAILVAYFAMKVMGLAGAGVGVLCADIAMIGFVVPSTIRKGSITGRAWLGAILMPPVFLFKRI